jgi:hypothetical protein
MSYVWDKLHSFIHHNVEYVMFIVALVMLILQIDNKLWKLLHKCQTNGRFQFLYNMCDNKHHICYIVMDETIQFSLHVSWAMAYMCRRNHTRNAG